MRILRSWLSNEDFDVVHVHEPFTPTISLSALKHSTKPTIATFHAETPHGWLLRLVKTFVPWAVKRLDAGIAVSKAALGVADSYLDITPVIIGNGIAINNFPPLSATTTRWRGGDRPRLVFVGRYDEPRKGFSVLIQALPIIRENVADLDVVVVGNGSMPNISGVRFIPKASDDDRNSWLATADVYIAPNTGRESFGIVLLEALACGAPVVASDLPAFVEVLSDDEGIVGRTFRVGDAHAAARAVIDALGEARDLHCERGRSRASCFDWDVIGPQIVDHYRLAGRHHHHL